MQEFVNFGTQHQPIQNFGQQIEVPAYFIIRNIRAGIRKEIRIQIKNKQKELDEKREKRAVVRSARFFHTIEIDKNNFAPLLFPHSIPRHTLLLLLVLKSAIDFLTSR